MTPQGVTRIINKLEKELDLTLFNRNTQGIQPTVHASILYNKCLDILSSIDELQHIKYRKNTQYELKILSTFGMLQYFGFDFFDAFKTQHPYITLSLIEYNDEPLSIQLKQKRAKFAFVTGTALNENFDHYFICKQKFLFLINKNHPLAHLKYLYTKDIAKYPFMCKGKDFNIYNNNISRFLECDTSPELYMSSSDNQLLIDFVIKKNGIAPMLEEQIYNPLYQNYMKDDVVIKECVDSDFSREAYFVVEKDCLLSPEEQLFVDYVLKYIHQ